MLGAALTASVEGTVAVVVAVVVVAAVVVLVVVVVEVVVAAVAGMVACVVPAADAPVVVGDGSGGTARVATRPADAAPASPSAVSDTMKRTRRSTGKSR